MATRGTPPTWLDIRCQTGSSHIVSFASLFLFFNYLFQDWHTGAKNRTYHSAHTYPKGWKDTV